MVAIRRVARDELGLVVGGIDRSEHVEKEYRVDDGRLVERPITVVDVPPWDPHGDGPHSVASHVAFCESAIDEHGAVALGAFEADDVAGLALVAPAFEPPLAWLAYLHVTRPHRRHGVSSTLWAESAGLARGGRNALYVSATPTGSAIGFYLSRGCRLADPVHAVLFEHEPEDVHLVCDL